jgi:hypothetical protein
VGTRVLANWIGRVGLLTAAVGLASVVSLLWDPAFTLLLLAALLSLVWLFATSIALRRQACSQRP